MADFPQYPGWSLYRTLPVSGGNFTADADFVATQEIPETFILPGRIDDRHANGIGFVCVLEDDGVPIAGTGTFTYQILAVIDYVDETGVQRSAVVTAGTAATSQAPGGILQVTPRPIGPNCRYAIRFTAPSSLGAGTTAMRVFVRGF